MRRFIQLIFAFWFAMAMAFAQTGISAAQTSSTYAGTKPDDTASYSSPSSEARPDSSGYTPEQSESRALTEYLTSSKLPLVGAQVLQRPDGRRMVVLYGFVGSDFGKADAVKKTHRYLHDSSITVDNRINVRPELLASNRPSNPAGNPGYGYPPVPGSTSNSEGASNPDTSSYPGPDSYKAQQANPYTQQLTSMMPLIALLGVLGMGISGGGSGFSLGASPFSSPYGSPPYSSPYGPSYTPPYGSPYASPPYGSPFSASPYGRSPYGSSPYGNAPYGSAPYPYP